MGGVGITTGMKKVLDLAAKARTADKATRAKGSKAGGGCKRPSRSKSASASPAGAAGAGASAGASASSAAATAAFAPPSDAVAKTDSSVAPSPNKARAQTKKVSAAVDASQANAKPDTLDIKEAFFKGAGSRHSHRSGKTNRGGLAVGVARKGGGAPAQASGEMGEGRVKPEMGCSERGGGEDFRSHRCRGLPYAWCYPSS